MLHLSSVCLFLRNVGDDQWGNFDENQCLYMFFWVW